MSRVASSTVYARAFEDMRRHQSHIAGLQDQIGSGKRIQRPSDDPAAAARALDVTETLNRIGQYQSNMVIANQRLALEDATLEGVGNLLVRVKELALAANSGTQTPETRNAYRTEVNERLSELLDFANVRDANGDYMFSGYRTDSRPFSMLAGSAVYSGDQGGRDLQISATRRVHTGDSGADVFMRVPGGNGRFTVDAAVANTGAGIIEAGSVADPSAFTYHDYSVRFTAPGTYDVVDDTLGVTVLAAQPYTPGSAIQFDGLETNITGQPAAGNRFDIAAARSTPIFETLQTFIDSMALDPADPASTAKQNQTMNGVIDSLDQALNHVLEVRASVGSRQSAIEAVEIESDALEFELRSTLSELEDLDVNQAIGLLQQRISGLEIVQQTFVSLAQLSLFNFLR